MAPSRDADLRCDAGEAARPPTRPDAGGTGDTGGTARAAAIRRGAGRLPLAAGALLLVFPALVYRGICENSVTVDEFAHMPAGYAYWQTGDFRLYAKNPPLIKLIATAGWWRQAPDIDELLLLGRTPEDAWGPWVFGTNFQRRNAAIYHSLFRQSRWVMVVLTLLAGVLVCRWSYELYGRGAALLSLGAFVFCPTVLAHGSLATTDAGAMLTFTLAAYGVWRYVRRPGAGTLALAAFAAAAAVLSKFSALLLGLAVPIVLAAGLVGCWRPAERGAGASRRISGWYAGGCLGMAVLGTGLVNLCYGFRGSMVRWGELAPRSRAMERVQSVLPAAMPTLLPREFLTGLDWQQLDVEQGEIQSYLDGQLSERGRWYYFPLAFVYKEPVALVGLTILSVLTLPLYAWLRLWNGFPGPRRWAALSAEAALLIPLLIFVFHFMFFSALNLGIRYLLPVYPLVFVHFGKLAWLAGRLGRPRGAAVALLAGLVLWQAVEVAWNGPDYISFFSSAVGGPMNGHRHLLDSNLDWGQDLGRLKHYMESHGIERVTLAYFGHEDPALLGILYQIPTERRSPGIWVVSANFLYGIDYPLLYARPAAASPVRHVAWLREKAPVARVGRSIFVFEAR